jgi:hypothetical protein
MEEQEIRRRLERHEQKLTGDRYTSPVYFLFFIAIRDSAVIIHQRERVWDKPKGIAMSISAANYKRFLEKENERVWNQIWKNETDANLIKITDKTKQRLDRLVDSFMPLFEQTLKIPKDTPAYYESWQYYQIYWMSALKLRIDGYAQVIRYMKKSEFADKFKKESSPETYNIMLEQLKAQKNCYKQIDLYSKLVDFLFQTGYNVLLNSLRDGYGDFRLEGKKFENATKDYFARNKPEDYWKVALKTRETMKQVKLVAQQKQIGNS